MTTALDMYTLSRKRLVELAATLDESRHETPVPALPLWTVRDAYAHLAGNVADALGDNLNGIGTDAWTAAQVATRADRTLSDICTEWMDNAEKFDARLAAEPALAGSAFDLWQHEQDIRAALGEPVDRDPVSVRFGLDIIVPVASAAWPAGTPSVRLVVEELDQEWQLGPDAPATTVRADGYELVRAMIGRRSRAQVEALGWTNPVPHLVYMPFEFAERDLVE